MASSAPRAAGALLVALATLLVACTAPANPTPVGPTATRPVDIGIPAGMQPARVVRVVDGDTIIVHLDGRDERLRYIGMDTPETVKPDTPVECYGEAAHQRNQQLVGGKDVFLAQDVSDRDQYGRLLRYVYLPTADGLLFVNLALVQDGYAQVATFPPDVAHEQEFRAAQREARAAKRGLWGACGG